MTRIDKRRDLSFERVKATEEEVAAYVKKNGSRPGVYRVRCVYCGKRMWGSGLGIGSHRKVCNENWTAEYALSQWVEERKS